MVLYALLAAICFALGGFFMKMSEGVSRLWPTAAFLVLFALGAILQSLAMRRSDMGAVYIAVLGLEAILALTLATVFLHEPLSLRRLIAAGLVIAGTAMLRGL